MKHSSVILIDLIESAQRSMERFALSGFTPALDIERQLMWCWERVRGESYDPLPAPLCMAYLLEHGFAKFGAYPLLAEQLRTIEEHIEDLDLDGSQYAALAA